jgi:hypothetical protein
MEIENTAFGNITMDGKTYEHDVVVRLSGEVVKRKKKLSKNYYGTSHIPSQPISSRSLRPSLFAGVASSAGRDGPRVPRSGC